MESKRVFLVAEMVMRNCDLSHGIESVKHHQLNKHKGKTPKWSSQSPGRIPRVRSPKVKSKNKICIISKAARYVELQVCQDDKHLAIGDKPK